MKILSLSKISDQFTRYDIAVKGVHNFIAERVVVHNTSAHVKWKDGQIHYFSGGEKHENFVSLFTWGLKQQFEELGHPEVTVFGEAYGGKCQGMKDTYGPKLMFVAFEVKIGDSWLNVPDANEVSNRLGFEFVAYERIPATLEAIDAERDRPSVQATRNGIVEPKIREGIVLRPIKEMFKKNGERVIAKHKRDEFKETRTPRPVTEKSQIIVDAEKAAEEWVTPMRLQHVLDGFPDPGMEQLGVIIRAMIADVLREGSQEVIDSKDLRRAIGKKSAELFKTYFRNHIKPQTFAERIPT